MPSIYVSNRAKIQNLIEIILFHVKKNDLDYNSIIDHIAFETKNSRNKVKEILDFTIKVKGFVLTENNIITISDQEIPNWLKELREKEKNIKEMDKEMSKIEDSIKGGLKDQ